MDVIDITKDADTFTANVFLVLGENVTLIDAGTMSGVEDVIREYTDDIDQVVLTHQHGDHVGELDAVLASFDADLYAFGDHPERTHELTDGDEIQIGDEQFQVVHTPGHADDHISLVSENTLISGDVVVYNDGAFDDGSFGRTDMPEQSRETLIESIRELLARMPDGVSALYAGHGDVYEGDVSTVVERALSRAERKEPKYPDDG